MNILAILSIFFAFVTATGSAYEKVTTFHCDEDNFPLSPIIDNSTGLLEDEGMTVRICFKTTPKANSNGIYILKLDDFTFTKDRNFGDLAAVGPTRSIPKIIRQMAIDHGTPISNEMTEIFCNPGDEVCAFETSLTGYFFLTGGTIHGKGRVMTQRGRGRRDLQDMDMFQNVYIDLEFIGDGKYGMAPEQKRNGLYISLLVLLILLLICCCCVMFWCFTSWCCCCCVGTEEETTKNEVETKKGDSDDDFEDIESVPARDAYSRTRSSKREIDDGDVSETESLEDDQYWDDLIAEEEEDDSRVHKSRHSRGSR